MEFTGSWDLRRLRPHFFPRGSAVVFGRRSTTTATSLPAATELWSGRLPRGTDTWAAVEGHVTRVVGLATEAAAEGSAYGPRFSNGATIYPRLLFMVRPQQAGPSALPPDAVPSDPRAAAPRRTRGSRCLTTKASSRPSSSDRCCSAKASCRIGCCRRGTQCCR